MKKATLKGGFFVCFIDVMKTNSIYNLCRGLIDLMLFNRKWQMRLFCPCIVYSGLRAPERNDSGSLPAVIGFADLRFRYNPLASLTVGSG